MEMAITNVPDSLKVIDQAKIIDQLEEKLKLVELSKGVILEELRTAEWENEKLRKINRKYRQERQEAREKGEQLRLQGDRERGDRIRGGLLCGMIGAVFALTLVLGIIWAVGIA